MQDEKKIIYYDGDCDMCRVTIGLISGSSQQERFALKDMTRESLPEQITKEDVQKEIHVIGAQGKVYRNAEAIFEILKEYPRWRIVARLGGLPGIRQLSVVLYKLVAARRYLLFGPMARVFWLKTVTISGLIAGLLFSHRLWIGERSFPLTPIFSFFGGVPSEIGTILSLVLFGSLGAALILVRPQKSIFFALGAALALAMIDQMRWQPWFYQYMSTLAVLSLFSWRRDDENTGSQVLITTRFVVASIYFFSGVQKLNPSFVNGVFPWMIEPVATFLPAPLMSHSAYLGLAASFIEAGIGVGLFMKATRVYAALAAIFMHCFILFSLGPFGHNWNSVVWPWNVAMIGLVFTLFWREKEFSFRDIVKIRKSFLQGAVIILFGAMPVLNFFGMWDSYLSAALYSGNTSNARIHISDAVRDRLPTGVHRYTERVGAEKYVLDFFSWSFDELNVPPYPEARIYKDIARNICKYADESGGVSLTIFTKRTVFYKGSEATLYCSSL